MKDLISKNADGSYNLTSDGEQEIYFTATRKLLEHYLQNGLKKDRFIVAEKLNSLPVFIYTNFRSMDDYLNKLPELAKYIEENNVERFQKYMGQNFVSALNKEKNLLINKQINLLKDKLDNPFWTPSYALLKKYELNFINAPQLKFSPAEEKENPVETDIQVKSIAVETEEIIINFDAPGNRFLKKYEKQFNSSRTLDLKLFIIHEEIESSEEIENPEIQVNEQTLQNIFEDPPGNRFLLKYGSQFDKSPRLEFDTGLKKQFFENTSNEKLFSLKSFASILSTISRFTKNKDNAGYQNWYKTLSNYQKAAIKLNSRYNTERKGEVVDWGKEIMLLALSLNENKQDVYKLANEIKLYTKVINIIKNLMNRLSTSGFTPADISNIYSQSIIILDSNDDIQDKKSSIKILMLQVTDEKERSHILNEFDKLLNALK